MHKPQHLRPGLLTSLVGLLAPLLLVPQLAAAQEQPPPPPPPPPADEGQGYGWEGSGEASGQTSAEANAAAPPGAGAQGRTETTAAELTWLVCLTVPTEENSVCSTLRALPA